MTAGTVNLFVDWASEFHNPPWQANDRLSIESGRTTVFDLFSNPAVTPALVVQSEGAGEGIYVTAIDGVVQNADGNQYWWVYSVNNSDPEIGANAYFLMDGDTVAWDYKHIASGRKQATHPGLR
jgi:uncharacterized protein DUF4430